MDEFTLVVVNNRFMNEPLCLKVSKYMEFTVSNNNVKSPPIIIAGKEHIKSGINVENQNLFYGVKDKAIKLFEFLPNNKFDECSMVLRLIKASHSMCRFRVLKVNDNDVVNFENEINYLKSIEQF